MDFFDDSSSPAIASPVQSAHVAGNDGAGLLNLSASGQTWDGSGAVGGIFPVGSSITALRIGRGLVALGVGGYAAPVEE